MKELVSVLSPLQLYLPGVTGGENEPNSKPDKMYIKWTGLAILMGGGDFIKVYYCRKGNIIHSS